MKEVPRSFKDVILDLLVVISDKFVCCFMYHSIFMSNYFLKLCILMLYLKSHSMHNTQNMKLEHGSFSNEEFVLFFWGLNTLFRIHISWPHLIPLHLLEPKYQHIEVETKWRPFYRWPVQMHFLEWKCMNFDWNFTEVYSLGVELTIFHHWFR